MGKKVLIQETPRVTRDKNGNYLLKGVFTIFNQKTHGGRTYPEDLTQNLKNSE